MLAQTQQQKDAVFTAQQSNVSRLLRANKVALAAVYSSCSAKHSFQLQRHFIRLLCCMNRPRDAVRYAEEWAINNELDVERMMQVAQFSAARALSSLYLMSRRNANWNANWIFLLNLTAAQRNT
jgi:hypothetical protein